MFCHGLPTLQTQNLTKSTMQFECLILGTSDNWREYQIDMPPHGQSIPFGE